MFIEEIYRYIYISLKYFVQKAMLPSVSFLFIAGPNAIYIKDKLFLLDARVNPNFKRT